MKPLQPVSGERGGYQRRCGSSKQVDKSEPRPSSFGAAEAYANRWGCENELCLKHSQ